LLGRRKQVKKKNPDMKFLVKRKNKADIYDITREEHLTNIIQKQRVCVVVVVVVGRDRDDR
jgi:hypothetical protein